MKIRKSAPKRRIVADEEVEVAPEATELLLEMDDAAELVAEITGEDVSVEADGDMAEFTVGEDVYTVEAEGDEEVLQSVKIRKRPVRASRRPARRVVRRQR